MTQLFPAVILAGGLATRLQPKTLTMPKALIEVGGKAFVDHQLEYLQKQGITEVIMCLGKFGEQIEAHVQTGQQYNLSVRYCYDGDTLLGTGGAIKKAARLLPDNFFVLYGDSYLRCDYHAIQTAFLSSNKAALMTVYHNHGQHDRSNVEFNAGKFIHYDKFNPTPAMEYIDYGLGILSQRAVELIPPQQIYDLAYLYLTLSQEGQLAGYEVHERFYEIGSFDGIASLNEFFMQPTEG